MPWRSNRCGDGGRGRCRRCWCGIRLGTFDGGRAEKVKNVASYLNFGDGPHRCPGSQVALHETRMFLDRLMRVPGIRLEKPPAMILASNTQSYEIREAVVACDKA